MKLSSLTSFLCALTLTVSTVMNAGQARGSAPTLSIASNPFHYSKYYSDEETGLCYCNARYYSPGTGMFTSRDSFSLANRYAYGNGNPVMNIDPSGHSSIGDFFEDNWKYFAIGGVALAVIGGGALAYKCCKGFRRLLSCGKRSEQLVTECKVDVPEEEPQTRCEKMKTPSSTATAIAETATAPAAVPGYEDMGTFSMTLFERRYSENVNYLITELSRTGRVLGSESSLADRLQNKIKRQNLFTNHKTSIVYPGSSGMNTTRLTKDSRNQYLIRLYKSIYHIEDTEHFALLTIPDDPHETPWLYYTPEHAHVQLTDFYLDIDAIPIDRLVRL